MQDRVVAHAERRGDFAGDDRLADQELARRSAVVVVIVDEAVVERQEAIILERLIAHRHRREQQLRMRVDFVRLGDEGRERIAGLDRALEVDVVGEGANQFVDDGVGQALLERGLVDALVEAHAAVVLLLRIGALGGVAAQRHRHVDAVVVDRDRRLELLVGVDRYARDRRRPAFGRRLVVLQDDLLSLGDGRFSAPGAESGEDRLGGVLARAVGAQQILECFAASQLHQAFAAVGPGARGGLDGVRDVFRHHAHFDRSERSAGALGAARRVGREPSGSMPAWLVRISSICGGSGGALSPAAVALVISTTCACASASVSSPVAAAASPAVRSRWENATSASSCIGPDRPARRPFRPSRSSP